MYSVLYGMDNSEFEKNSKRYLEKFDLIDYLDNPVKNFSKGMKQKLSLIKSIQHNPEILILDEPFSGVDPQMRLIIRQILFELKNIGVAIFITSHDLDEIQKIADKIIIIEKGKIIVNKDKKKLFEKNGFHYELKYLNEFQTDIKLFIKSLDFLSIELNEDENIMLINSQKELFFEDIYQIMLKKIKIKEFNRIEESLENIYFQSLKNNEY